MGHPRISMKQIIIYHIDRLREALGEEGEDAIQWLEERIDQLGHTPDASRLYISFSQCGSRFPSVLVFPEGSDPGEHEAYLYRHGIDALQYARMFLLSRLLNLDRPFYGEKIRKLIEVADARELQTFLRYLHTLPHAEEFLFSAVEALRTNIVPVFDAISDGNPYPESHFDEQQWNQMYLKAAFLGRDLNAILGVDSRANERLSRIISDYAHERWAAGREIDPAIWRPVTGFLNEGLLDDMRRLLASEREEEREAAALVCSASNSPEARALLASYPELQAAAEEGTLGWDRLGTRKTTL